MKEIIVEYLKRNADTDGFIGTRDLATELCRAGYAVRGGSDRQLDKALQSLRSAKAIRYLSRSQAEAGRFGWRLA